MQCKCPLPSGGWLVIGVCVGAAVLSSVARAGDWTRFRGPNRTGDSQEAGVPLTWSDTENLKWKTELPGPGFSSPIVVNDKVFVTCYTGYGIDREDPGQMEDLKRHLVCVDRKTGETVWSKTVATQVPEDPYKGFITEHGYASHTPTSDGERVYAFFGKTGVAAFDVQGEQLWQTNVGTESGPMRWGSAASPILYENLVIVNACDESQSLVAVDKETGKEVWRKTAPSLASNWTTPVLVDGKGGKDLVIAVLNEVWGLEPATGKIKWQVEGFQNRGYSASLFAGDGIAYCAGGMLGGASFALRTSGAADDSDPSFLWTERSYDSIISPLVHDGHLYGTTNRGIAYCLNAQTGQLVYQARLATGEAVSGDETSPGGGREDSGGAQGPGGQRGGPGGRSDAAGGQRPGGQTRGAGGRPPSERGRSGPGGGEYASPVLAGGRIYIVTRSGLTYVLAGEPEFKMLAKNQLESDNNGFCATPAVSDGDMFIRSNKHLYCVSDDSS